MKGRKCITFPCLEIIYVVFFSKKIKIKRIVYFVNIVHKIFNYNMYIIAD